MGSKLWWRQRWSMTKRFTETLSLHFLVCLFWAFIGGFGFFLMQLFSSSADIDKPVKITKSREEKLSRIAQAAYSPHLNGSLSRCAYISLDFRPWFWRSLCQVTFTIVEIYVVRYPNSLRLYIHHGSNHRPLDQKINWEYNRLSSSWRLDQRTVECKCLISNIFVQEWSLRHTTESPSMGSTTAEIYMFETATTEN